MRRLTIALLCSTLFASMAARADGLSFSWVDASGASLKQNQGSSGHGSRLGVSYALSSQAFMYADGRRDSLGGTDRQSYRAGVGINTDPAAGYVLFATIGWNNAGAGYAAAPGIREHGYDAGVGVRVLLAPRWEAYAAARYQHNGTLNAHAQGDAGVYFALSSRVAVGAGVTIDAQQTAYLFRLRVSY